MKPENKNLISVIKLLALHLGLEPSDIEDQDFLKDDLHMRSSDIGDFLEILNGEGFNTSAMDFSVIETVEDLADSVSHDTDI